MHMVETYDEKICGFFKRQCNDCGNHSGCKKPQYKEKPIFDHKNCVEKYERSDFNH